MLNGDTPIEGSYSAHLKEQLGEDSDDSDSEYGSSNPYQSVRKNAVICFEIVADCVTSPPSVMSLMRECLFPPALVTILAKRTLGP